MINALREFAAFSAVDRSRVSGVDSEALRLKGLPRAAVDGLNAPILIGSEEYRFLMALGWESS